MVENWLVVGLGNPGTEHHNTRHNAGFMAIDAIRKEYGFSPEKEKFSGLLSEGIIEGVRVYALKPLTYMNLSGNSVQKALAFYKLPIEQLIVIHDELDVALGKVKLKQGGGAAGHNGIRNIDQMSGNNYHRVRIGIGNEDKDGGRDYVLSRFNADEATLMDVTLDAIAGAFHWLVQGNNNRFMTAVADKIREKTTPPKIKKETIKEKE